MSLIVCDECGHKISDRSLFCPSCGYPTYMNRQMAGTPKPEAIAALEQQFDNASEPCPENKSIKPDTEPESEVSEKLHEAETEAAIEAEESDTDPHRSNERIKVILFLTVFIALLGVVLYVYFTAPVEQQAIEEMEEDTTELATGTDEARNDTTEATDTVVKNAVTTSTAPVVPTVPAKPKATPKPAAPAASMSEDAAETSAREVTVKSLREQATEPSQPQHATEPAE